MPSTQLLGCKLTHFQLFQGAFFLGQIKFLLNRG